MGGEQRPGYAVREVLRRAGYRECAGERGHGFLVEGGEDGAPYYVAYVERPGNGVGSLAGCAAALRAAGFHVMRDPHPPHGLEVWRPHAGARPVLPARWRTWVPRRRK